MFTYPVHQAADVLFCRADLVPVGRDQLPHLELTRCIARRFNERYGTVFALPEALLGQAPVLAGLDGRKMAKSLGNGISLTDPADVVAAKIRAARTDSERLITFEPERRPFVANLLNIAGLCSRRDPADIAATVGSGGAAGLKDVTTQSICEFLAPIQQRRRGVGTADARGVLARGTTVAKEIAEHTLGQVRTAMGMAYPHVAGRNVAACVTLDG